MNSFVVIGLVCAVALVAMLWSHFGRRRRPMPPPIAAPGQTEPAPRPPARMREGGDGPDGGGGGASGA